MKIGKRSANAKAGNGKPADLAPSCLDGLLLAAFAAGFLLSTDARFKYCAGYGVCLVLVHEIAKAGSGLDRERMKSSTAQTVFDHARSINKSDAIADDSHRKPQMGPVPSG